MTKMIQLPSGIGPGFRRWALLQAGQTPLDESQDPEDITESEAERLSRVTDSLSPKEQQRLQERFFDKVVNGANEWFRFEVRPGVDRYLRIVAGHVWGDPGHPGPRRSKVMVIGKCLGPEEQTYLQNLIGPAGMQLKDACRRNKIPTKNWYVTSVIKTIHPDDGNGWYKSWLDEWLPVLRRELEIVRPEYIMCLGSESLKAILGNRESLKKSEGRLYEVEYPVGESFEKALVMGVTHPTAVLHKPQLAGKFEREVARFGQVLQGARWDLGEEGLDHRVILTMSDLLALEKEIRETCEDNLIAIDAEWEGAHPENKGSGLVSIQLSWKHKTAACIGLRSQGGVWRFQDGDIKQVMRVIYRILKGRQLAGHFIVADLEWLEAEGLPALDLFRVPDTPEKTRQAILEGRACGIDTAYAMHAIEETAELSLKAMAVRLTEAPRYDLPLKEWLEAEKARRSKETSAHNRKIRALLKKAQKEGESAQAALDELAQLGAQAQLSDEEEEVGFGQIPDEIRDPYACLQQGSLVQLADGSWEKIDVLVKQQYSGCVKSLHPDGRVVDARVTGWHRAEVNQKEWFRLQTQGAKYSREGLMGPALTPDHKILTPRGKVQVRDLRPGEDSIATEEPVFSKDQLSVFLGSLLGDGGFQRRNRNGVGFGFGQTLPRAEYADWKASVFSEFGPRAIHVPGSRRYTLPFSRYLHALSLRFPTHGRAEHSDRKVIITQDVLDHLGDLGLAVWYQDDGTLPRDARTGAVTSCRIYARRLTAPELELLLPWLSARFGEGVSYSTKGGFVQFVRAAFTAFQAAILPFVHPACAYKVVGEVRTTPKTQPASERFYDPIVAVVPCRKTVRRGTGVRYCLSVEGTRNFLTKVGFVSNCYDADVTRRIAVIMKKWLDGDQFGNPCWRPFWITMRALPAVLEINRAGMMVSRERLDHLTMTYMSTQTKLLAEIRRLVQWPDFNPDSHFEAREVLFGEKYNKKAKDSRQVERIRPPGARSLYLTPTMTTGKRAALWTEVRERGQENEKTASCGRMALAILSHKPISRRRDPKTGKIVEINCAKPLKAFRDYKVIAQVLRSTLRRPKTENGVVVRRPDGWLDYAKGLPGAICDDGRVRTHIYPTKETGRWSSSRPPLQNLSKRREADYRGILGKEYPYPLRSILEAAPGCLLVEADYIGAELFGMAVLAGDQAMIRDVLRNQLPETDPNFYDIHSNIAVEAFRLSCDPTKAGLESIGRKELRDIAKTVIFGIAYGRQAKAISVAAREQGTMISEEEAEAVRQAIFQRYPGLEPFFAECRRRASQERFIVGCLGRMRRAPETHDTKIISDLEREFMNMPIQGLIGDVVARAVDHLLQIRVAEKLTFRLVMQIHDAIILEVPYHEIDRVNDYVLPEAMRVRVPILPCRLDGTPMGTGPYHLGIDTNVYKNWGIQMSPEQLQTLAVSPRHAGWHPHPSGGWSHPGKAGKIWLDGNWVSL